MGPAYFRFDQPPYIETFVISISDPKKSEQARKIIADSSGNVSRVSGIIIKRPVWYNRPWSYHLDPASIGFGGEVYTEVCDAAIRYIQEHLDEVGGDFLPRSRWCPWGARLIEEISFSGRPLEFKAICTETAEHDGAEYPLTDWLTSEDAANAAGKDHELSTRGHRWRIASREHPDHRAPEVRRPPERGAPATTTVLIITSDRAPTVTAVARDRFIFEIIGLAVAVYDAYTSFKDAVSPEPEPVEAALNEVRQGIERINETLHEIRATLAQILELLRNLPEVLAGIAEENTLRESLDRLHGITDAIRNYLGDIDTFIQARDEVQRLCNRLQEEMYVAIDYSRGGLAAIINVTPAYVIYARAWMMLYRLPNSTRLPDIWATTMHQKMMDVFLKVFEEHKIYHSALSTEFLAMPKTGITHKFDGSKFVERGPVRRCYESGAHNSWLANTFRFSYSSHGGGEMLSLLHRNRACWIAGTVDWVQVPGYLWWDAASPAPWDDPGHVAAAEARFRQFIARRKEILEYFEMMKNAEEYERRINECLFRP